MEFAPWPGAVGVSGGSDSLALMHLLSDWTKARKVEPPVVLTVDHGLRKGSKAAAHVVRDQARALGLQTHILTWIGDKPEANLEAAAREARYALMAAWCRKHGGRALYVAHTRDDQAETFLIRLARGSGLDGLAAMAPMATVPGSPDVELVRPLLGTDRSSLQSYLGARGVAWCDDPMNEEQRFARVRIRALWPALETVGLTRHRVADAAGHLTRARAALEAATQVFLDNATVDVSRGTLLDKEALLDAEREIGLRALARILMRITGAAYRPRFERLERLYDALISEEFRKARTLHGCRIGPAPRALATFGPSTVVIVKENSRKARPGGETGGAVLA